MIMAATNFDGNDVLRAESALFRDALAKAAPDAPVPTCPDWTADDLLWHLTEVQHFWAAMLADDSATPETYTEPDRPEDRAALFALFDSCSELLVSRLRETDDSQPAWTWFEPDQSVGFIRRRQVHEALIHRVDAELTAGLASPIDPSVAADGIDEALTVMFGTPPSWATVKPAGPIGTVTTADTGDTWLIQVQSFSGTSPNTGNTYDGEPVLAVLEDDDAADASFMITGTAADLDRWFWSRSPVGAIDRQGDTSALDAVVAVGLP